MRSDLLKRTTSSPAVRRLLPWAVVVLIGALLVGIMPTVQAQTGSSAADAIPIGTDGKFAGTDAANQSLWYKFNYVGGGATATTTLTFEPADSTRLDFFYYTGDPSNPTSFNQTTTLSGNVRTLNYTDPGGPRVVFIKVENDHSDRSVSFVGALTPTSVLATPTPTSATNPATPQVTPTAGPVAGNAGSAITIVDANGEFSGTLAPGQAVWYRAYYGNPGADMTISISVAPTADNADMNVYTGTDVTNLGPTQQGGSQVRNGNTISRHVNLPSAQFIYFSLGDNGSNILAYGGTISPFAAPPAASRKRQNSHECLPQPEETRASRYCFSPQRWLPWSSLRRCLPDPRPRRHTNALRHFLRVLLPGRCQHLKAVSHFEVKFPRAAGGPDQGFDQPGTQLQ